MFKVKDILITIYILITLSSLIAIIAVLCNQWSYSYTTCDNLSKNYKDYVITSTANPSIIEFTSYLSCEYNQFRLQKQTSKGYSGIYLKNYNMNLNLIEGREFCKDDFDTYKDVVIIAERCIKNTYKEGNKRYIVIEKNVYEVIGVFTQKENPVNENTDIFINMFSNQFLSMNDGINGRYYFDCEQDLNTIVQTKYKIKENSTIYEMGISKHFQLVKDTMFISWKAILCVGIFSVLSWIFLFVIWLTSEKNIILVNYICGATRKKIFFLMIKKWILTNLSGTIVSTVLGTILLISRFYCLLFLGIYILYSLLSGSIILFFINSKIKEMR